MIHSHCSRLLQGVSLLVGAASNGAASCVHLLLASGVPVNQRNADGATPLMRAARWGHVTSVRYLLDAGADVTLRDDLGRNFLFHAVASDDVTCVVMALKAGVHINQWDTRGKSVLDYYIETQYSLLKFRLRLFAQILFIAGEKLDDFVVNRFIFCDYMYEEPEVPFGQDPDEVVVNSNGDMKLLSCLGVTKRQDLSLLNLSRVTIRRLLIAIDPRRHLFDRVTQLGLPTLMEDYLLYGRSLERIEELEDRHLAWEGVRTKERGECEPEGRVYLGQDFPPG